MTGYFPPPSNLGTHMTHMKKNHQKGERYAYAFDQIKRAKEAGFFIEIVAICESIITDRLQSNALGTQVMKAPEGEGKYLSLGGIIGALRSNLPSREDTKSSETSTETARMLDAIDAWRLNRNKILHGLVKSMPGTSPGAVEEFRERAQHSAEEGENLARTAIRWHEQQRRAAARPSA